MAGASSFSSNWRIGHQIYVVNADGTGGAPPDRPSAAEAASRGSIPTAAASCTSAAATSRDTSRPTEIDLATGEEKALVDWPALNYNPAYSPDAARSPSRRTSPATGWSTASGSPTASPGGSPSAAARSPDYRP